jgi:hypothetical protein
LSNDARTRESLSEGFYWSHYELYVSFPGPVPSAMGTLPARAEFVLGDPLRSDHSSLVTAFLWFCPLKVINPV